jgi:hypothetical protein
MAPRTSRRSFIGAAAATLALASVSPILAQESTPVSRAEGDSDAVAVLKSAGEAVLDLDTFTFDMRTTQGSSTIFPGVELISVVGAVRRPFDLVANLTVKAFVQTMEIGAVAVDGEFYVQDPLSGGDWQQFGSAQGIANMVNPDWIIVAAVNQIKDASITDESDESTLVEGYLDFSETLSQAQGGDSAELEQLLAMKPVDIAIWINGDNLIERVELYGPIFASESPDVEKRIELGGFNEPVEIEKPVV